MAILEKRSMARFNLKLQSHIFLCKGDQNETRTDLVTSDICAGGAFFPTENPLPIGTRVNIHVVLPLNYLKNGQIKHMVAKNSLVRVSGAIIRTEKKGMAIRFDEEYEILPLVDRDKSH